MEATIHSCNVQDFTSMIKCIGKFNGLIHLSLHSTKIRFLSFGSDESWAFVCKIQPQFFSSIKLFPSYPKHFSIDDPKHLEMVFRNPSMIQLIQIEIKNESQRRFHDNQSFQNYKNNYNNFTGNGSDFKYYMTELNGIRENVEDFYVLIITLVSHSGIHKKFMLSISECSPKKTKHIDNHWVLLKLSPLQFKKQIENVQYSSSWLRFCVCFPDIILITSESIWKESVISNFLFRIKEEEIIVASEEINHFQNIELDDLNILKNLLSHDEVLLENRVKKIEITLRLSHIKAFLQLCYSLNSKILFHFTPQYIEIDGAHARLETLSQNNLMQIELHTMARMELGLSQNSISSHLGKRKRETDNI